MAAAAVRDIESRTTAKIAIRLVPFLIVCYFVAYLDRVNVGFAKLTMDSDLGLSDTMFGFGAGVFFLTYFLLEVPSNLFLDRFGARRWIARIMFTWGLISGAMAFIPEIAAGTGVKDEYVFYFLRALLGAAEAGFFPGIIFYLTLWFPSSYRGRIIGYFMAAIPLSSAIGSPVSASLLQLNGVGGLAGWQWLFIAEAAPALVLAFVVLFYLTDYPKDAGWLAADERDWISQRLVAEERQRVAVHQISIGQALLNPRVLALALVYFGAVACNYGISFWLPTIVKGFGVSIAMTGWINAIPYLVGFVGMIWYGRRSDAKMERSGHAAVAMAIAAIGIGASAFLDDPLLKMTALTLGAFGVFAVLPIFWTLPTAFLSGSAAAAGIAVINSIGNLAGYFGPFLMGWLHDLTGSFSYALLAIAGAAAIATVIVLVLGHDSSLERTPETVGKQAARSRS
jgi:ACS family tartrate transporter-like MFS transporter